MKKIFKMIGSILGYLAIHICIGQMTIFAYSFYITITQILGGHSLNFNKIINTVNDAGYILIGISSIITLIVFVLILRYKEKNLFQRCNFKKLNRSQIGKITIITLALGFFTTALVTLMAHNFESYQSVSDGITNSYSSILSMVSIIIIAPIFEEILFRGLIFNKLKDNINIIVALIVQALIFGLIHGNPLQTIYTFILGIILAIFYIWTGSIWSNILCHMIYNLCGSVVIPLIVGLTPQLVYVYLVIGIILTIAMLILIIEDYKNNLKTQI